MHNKNDGSAQAFTPRQMEVLKCLWQGKRNKAIADELHMFAVRIVRQNG